MMNLMQEVKNRAKGMAKDMMGKVKNSKVVDLMSDAMRKMNPLKDDFHEVAGRVASRKADALRMKRKLKGAPEEYMQKMMDRFR